MASAGQSRVCPALATSRVSDAQTISRPVFAPGLDILYDIHTRTFFQWNESSAQLEQFYVLPEQSITESEAKLLIAGKRLPKSLQDTGTADVFAQRFAPGASTIPSVLLTYHSVYDSIYVEQCRGGAGTVNLYEYVGKETSDSDRLSFILRFIRPVQDLYHRCRAVIVCSDGVFFCKECSSFFTREKHIITTVPYSGMSSLRDPYARIPVGKITLSKEAARFTRKSLFSSRISHTIKKGALEYLSSIFKIDFSYLLPNVPPSVILSLLLNYCVYVDHKGKTQSAQEFFGSTSFHKNYHKNDHENSAALVARTNLRRDVIDDMVIGRLERQHLERAVVPFYLRINSEKKSSAPRNPPRARADTSARVRAKTTRCRTSFAADAASAI